MGNGRARAIPFVVQSSPGTTLTEQIVQGFTGAVRSGFYKPGDTLPSISDAAESLGVSDIVVRTAVKRLAQKGVVTPRPGKGIEVRKSGEHLWNAHVLFCHWAGPESWYYAVRDGAFAQCLHENNVLLSSVALRGDIARGCAKTMTILDSQPVAMAVLEGAIYNRFDVTLAERGVPFVQLHPHSVSPLALGSLTTDLSSAYVELRDHCLACGIKKDLLLVCGETHLGALRKLLDDAGIGYDRLPALVLPDLGAPESVERGGLQIMQSYLATHRELPRLIYAADDFTARGVLTAILAAGLRIPEDVQVIVMANRSLGPVFTRPMTRIEMDATEHGKAMAEFVIQALKKPRKRSELVTISGRFIVGETTRPVATG